MEILPIKLRTLTPPKDDLCEAIIRSRLKLKEGDIVAVSSKVVSIAEGRTLPIDSIDKDALVEREADWFIRIPTGKYRRTFTVAAGGMASSSGIDQSNGNGHYILYPKDPFESAKKIRKELMRLYGIKTLGLIITDSTSIPLRRGAIGFALAWDGFVPLKDYRKSKDLFGRPFKAEIANIVDGLAAAAVVSMGEGNEGTPVAIIRGANVVFGNRKSKEPLAVAPKDDIYAPLLFKNWKKGGKGSRSGT